MRGPRVREMGPSVRPGLWRQRRIYARSRRMREVLRYEKGCVTTHEGFVSLTGCVGVRKVLNNEDKLIDNRENLQIRNMAGGDR